MRKNHGMSHKRLHNIWCTMRERCFNPNFHKYNLYGGRGITICEEWSSFEAFMKWSLDNGYAADLTLDRIDGEGDYCPENCRWVTQKVQQNNRRNNRLIEWAGKMQNIQQWADELGIPYHTLYCRVYRGWSSERIFTQPLRR